MFPRSESALWFLLDASRKVDGSEAVSGMVEFGFRESLRIKNIFGALVMNGDREIRLANGLNTGRLAHTIDRPACRVAHT